MDFTVSDNEGKRRVLTIPEGGRRSRNPRPDCADEDFLEEESFAALGDVCLSAFLQCMNLGGYSDRARGNRERVHRLQEAERLATAALPVEPMDEATVKEIIENLSLVPSEVDRQVKRGIPRRLNKSELTSVATTALVDACMKHNAATRLAIRGALKDLVRYHMRFVDISFDVTTEATRTARFDWGLVDGLPCRQAQAFTLVHRDELTELDAATKMGITQQAVSRLNSKAKKKLSIGVVKQAA